MSRTPVNFYAHASEQHSWQRLNDHLQQTSALAAKFAEPFQGADLAKTAGKLHDLGKYTTIFQERLSGKAPPVDHSTAGALKAKEYFSSNPPAAQTLAFCIAGHHAGLANGRGCGNKLSALEQRLQKSFGSDLPELDPIWKDELSVPDALAFPPLSPRRGRAQFQFSFLTRMLYSCLVDADFQDTEAYFAEAEGRAVQRGGFCSLAELREQLDHSLADLDGDGFVNRRRQEILHAVRGRADEAPGNFSLTVPTGGGKTLTTLAFALDHAIRHDLDRVIYVIPFTSIVEQNAAVFRDALGELGAEAVLEHHSQYVEPHDYTAQAQDKLRLAMENWDAPIVVTTAVQLFESLFSNSPSRCRKLHNIAASVLILDEAQTLPLGLLRPCLAALDELSLNYRSSLVLCTATQPAVHEDPEDTEGQHSLAGGLPDVRELAPAPRQLYEDFRRVRVRCYDTEMDDDTLAEFCLEKEQILCIVNNRRHALALYDLLSNADDGIFQLTTLMCAKHRSKVLAEIRERLRDGAPCRLVATSLVEAGVDIDFPSVLRAEAGLDSIAQAAGRCNREGKRSLEESEVVVFSNPDWPTPPELEQLAQAAREVMRYHDDPLSLEAIDAYFRLLYWQRESGDDQGLDKHALMERIHRARLDVPFEDIAREFRMIEDTQKPVIIPWDEEARKAAYELQYTEGVGYLARRLQPYTVNVPERIFQQLRDSGAVQPISPERLDEQFPLLINEGLYDQEVGIRWDEPDRLAPENTIF
ncbi:CRISPR-associated endonuclease Cas3'' [Halorhodospira halochloris]|uniref:CRISPR-associated endonuclease Cas3'' n=1 Tax=Halorhodospira halochloris TaxID=1052 RepID=UPI001EE7D72C|nr:CRISPR-associated endonuclease Cas3'' [Halorhodospira halochloris]MCG5549273.1 CRISPR-associated endonuclease Cas3'' [Halorhodospira halochloris]